MTTNHELGLPLRRLMILAGVSATVYALNRLLFIQMMPEFGFLRQYLSDILALPVYLPVSLFFAWRLHLIPVDYRLHFTHILAAVVIFSLIFEGIIPVFDKSTIGDPFDILAYFAGGFLVYIVGFSVKVNRI